MAPEMVLLITRGYTQSEKSDVKSFRRDQVEQEFEGLLKKMAPSETVLDLARDVVLETWKQKKSEYNVEVTELDRKKKEADQQVQGFMARLLETQNRSMIQLYEGHIQELERKRTMLSAQAKQMYKIDTSFESAVGTVYDFIVNPHQLWHKGDLEDKRLVLKLAFAQRMPFAKETGFGTAAMSLPFKVMSDMSRQNSGLVEDSGIEPLTS